MSRATIASRAAAIALLLLLSCAGVPATAADADQETWTLVDAQPLPGQPARALPWPAGTRWTLSAAGLQGPAPLACPRARQQWRALPPQGLFQGALQDRGPAGAAAAAQALGLPGERIATLRLDCANASFDLHRDADGALRLALDGQVLRWRRDAAHGGPQTVVRALLLQHLAADGFDARRLDALAPWLSRSLQRRFARWAATPAPPDEVPPLDGDPFTDSQEPPAALEPGPARRDGSDGRARVPVRLLFDGRPARTLHYLLRYEDGQWRVDDLDYGRGLRLSRLLADPGR